MRCRDCKYQVIQQAGLGCLQSNMQSEVEKMKLVLETGQCEDFKPKPEKRLD